MPASTLTSSPTANGRSTRTVVLKVSPKLLSRFPSDSTPSEDKDQIQEASSPPSSTSGDQLPPASSVDNASDAASTPANADANRRKSGGARGTKRGLNGDSVPKARGKPGPKKRFKMDDGTMDTNKLMPPAHKLGPRANQGAINAGLRALDRTGAPCRKWEKKIFQLKSFTGVCWDVPTWRAPKPLKTNDSNGDVHSVTVNGDSDSKANQTGSAVPSDKSNVGDGDLTPLPASVADSPGPAIAMAA